MRAEDALALAKAYVNKTGGGSDGKDGKSAYEYAKDGGYTGTEEEFAAKLAELMATTNANEVAY